MMKWIALLSMAVCSSAFAQPASSDPITVIRAQILQYWFPAVNLDYAVSFDLDRDGKLIGAPAVVANRYDHGGTANSLKHAIMNAQPFFLLRPEDYESWKHITTNFTPADKGSTDIYAFTKKDILGVATGMTEPAAKAAMTEQGCRLSSPGPQILGCTIKTGDQLFVQLTKNMSPNVVTAVKFVFRSGERAPNIVQSISAQFHTRPFNEVWHLSEFSNMDLTPIYDPNQSASSIPSWALTMSEPRLLEKDREALAERQRTAAPTPKF